MNFINFQDFSEHLDWLNFPHFEVDRFSSIYRILFTMLFKFFKPLNYKIYSKVAKEIPLLLPHHHAPIGLLLL
jgi:hypothetical protein